LLNPGYNVVVRPVVSDGIGEDDARSTLVVGLRDIAETLLSCGVPNLEFDLLILNLQHFYLEIDTDCCHITLLEYSFAKIGQKIGLTNPTVSHDYYLQQ
jgi:hypothetical protein